MVIRALGNGCSLDTENLDSNWDLTVDEANVGDSHNMVDEVRNLRRGVLGSLGVVEHDGDVHYSGNVLPFIIHHPCYLGGIKVLHILLDVGDVVLLDYVAPTLLNRVGPAILGLQTTKDITGLLITSDNSFVPLMVVIDIPIGIHMRDKSQVMSNYVDIFANRESIQVNISIQALTEVGFITTGIITVFSGLGDADKIGGIWKRLGS